MVNNGLLVTLVAKPGQEDTVADFLKSGLEVANRESGTLVWFALQLDERTFGIFDAFADDAARTAHLQGDLAAALMAKAPELFATPPDIKKVQVLAAKGA
ncbi:MAG: antibiotic biosynthesis monooxygenase [Myxococcales bacterium]|nr:antibiotic biosynthesis monooxygenase [Myxococcales bacterium]MCB9736008.1 antibiotic biosynthesis monooxygenase [Deltaproteobacteria bacterium]